MHISVRASILPLALAVCLAAGITGCTNKSNGPETNSKSMQTKLWKKYDTPPGADKSVSAEMGGEGFEKVAESLGYVTYTPKPEELKYFGDPRAKVGGEYHTTISRFPASFRPFGENSHYTENNIIGTLVYQTLLGAHPITNDFIPSLATHWKISSDKMTYTFRIDPNARFSDGKPVTSEDVIATWKLMMDETIQDPSQQLVFGKFEQPKAISKYILEVKSKELSWRNLLYFSGMYILPAHEIGKLTGKEFLDKYQFTMPAGSGEYILLNEDVVNQRSYVLTRRDDWYAKNDPMNKYTGNFDRISFEVVQDNILLEYEKFKKGDQDFFLFNSATTENWVNDTTYEALQKGWVQKRRVFTNGPWGSAGYGFNTRKPPFDDIRIRKAFAYLDNREAIISKLLYNEYVPSDSYYDNTVYVNPDNPKVRYNPELASQLLAEAGWKTKNAEGILMKDGKPFVVEMGIYRNIERFVTPYQQELRKVGIDLQLKNQDPNILFKNMMERNFQIAWINWSGLVTPNPETSYKSSLADESENNNIEGVKDPQIDALCAMYDTTFSKEGQIKIIRDIDKIVMNNYFDALSWYPNGLRIAFWDKFGMPEYVYPRYTQFGYVDLAIFSYWWYDADKDKALQEAKKNKTPLPKGAIPVTFWKEFKQ